MHTPQSKSSRYTGKSFVKHMLFQQIPAIWLYSIFQQSDFLTAPGLVSHTKVNRAVLPLFPGQPVLWGTCQHYQWDFPYQINLIVHLVQYQVTNVIRMVFSNITCFASLNTTQFGFLSWQQMCIEQDYLNLVTERSLKRSSVFSC